ncbi:hypothetical protein [Paenibacillus thermotolerans]|uniref:hypothetical protein n=1 Tax=Paenibacillus thermotolerans TaxID=3027807 RepID=UPI0023687E76|nr:MULTISPECIES: hypothetical protein [unclassified Paenibacillus]
MANKVSLAEAMKQKLAQKKEAQASVNQQKHAQNGNMQMKSQIAKKPSAMKRRMGGG